MIEKTFSRINAWKAQLSRPLYFRSGHNRQPLCIKSSKIFSIGCRCVVVELLGSSGLPS
ncbi:hypothetical protein N9985_00825 [Gammaproteobacteria bacterium]|nr:hypothetical protein [Gammaproteobacteria bacterium]